MFIRQCPQCKKELYHTIKTNRNAAEKKKTLCRNCSSVKKSLGSKNPFYGKKHTVETKEKLRKYHTGLKHTQVAKDKVSKATKGNKNPMYGRKVFDIWVEKYGLEEANKREAKRKDSVSKAMSGSKNPMYGKTTPSGSGQGWKGWYKEIFFRSLRELSFMIKMDKEGISYQSAENIRIKYINWDGRERTYSPDFLVGNKLIEVKPTRMFNTPLCQCKLKAAEVYCTENNLVYELIDVPIVDYLEIADLVNSKDIIWQGKYGKKFDEYGKRFVSDVRATGQR